MVIQGVAIINLIIAVIGSMSCVFSLYNILFGIKRDLTTSKLMLLLSILLLVRNICLAFLQMTQGMRGTAWEWGIYLAGFGTFLLSLFSAYIISIFLLIKLVFSRKRIRILRSILTAFLIICLIFLIWAQTIGRLVTINDYGMLDYYHEWVSSDKSRSLSLLKMIFDMIELENNTYIELISICQKVSELKSENDRLRTAIEELTISKEHQGNEIIRIIHQNDSKQKELMKQIKISDNEKNELYALREFVFSLGKNTTYEIYDSSDILQNYIDYNEIVIIGGHIKWTQKVKELIPNIDIISADQKRVDLNFIRNKKLILFFINYLSHSLYFQVISKIQPNQKIGYIKQRNISDLIREITRIYLKQ